MKTNFIILFFLPFLLLFVNISYAQDKIYKKKGEIIEGKIIEITKYTINFKRVENPDGLIYILPKTDVIKIKYSNGTEERIADNNETIHQIKDNAITLAGNVKSLVKQKYNNYIGTTGKATSEPQTTTNIQPEIKDKQLIPPLLQIKDNAIIFIGANNNQYLAGRETGTIQFTLINNGKGDAKNLVVNITNNHAIRGVKFSNAIIGTLAAGSAQIVKIPVIGEVDLETSLAELSIKVTEENGFDADPITISFKTAAFKQPEIKVVDYQLNSEDGGNLKLGYPVNVKVLVQNTGQGMANNVAVTFNLPEKVFATAETKFDIGKLEAGNHAEINFGFTANKLYSNKTIPILIEIKEQFGEYGRDTTITAIIDQSLTKLINVNIASDIPQDHNIEVQSLTADIADIDKNIPQINKPNPNLYALIIGNEDYKSYQTGLNDEANVAYARNDAEIFKKYCTNTFGLTNDNHLIFIKDATAGKINQAIDKLVGIIKNTDGQAEIIVYYAGHGLPDDATKDAYLIPVDITGTDITQGIKLQTLYTKLTQYPSKKITVFLDACFTGGGRGQSLLAARSIKIKPKEYTLSGNIVVFTASSGDQTSLPYKEKQHGLFTYLLLKKIQATKGDISYKDLSNYLRKEVPLQSIIINNKEPNEELKRVDRYGIKSSLG